MKLPTNENDCIFRGQPKLQNVKPGTVEKEDHLKRLYANGFSLPELLKLFGYRPDRLFSILGLSISDNQKEYDALTKLYFDEYYRGMTLRDSTGERIG